MKTLITITKVFSLSFIMALTAYAQEQGDDFPPPPKPTAEMRAEFKAKIANLKSVCATDIATLCADAEGPHIIRCLKQNQSSLTVSACQTEVAQIPNRPPHPRPANASSSSSNSGAQ